jgi:PAS domain S-box-containing protein
LFILSALSLSPSPPPHLIDPAGTSGRRPDPQGADAQAYLAAIVESSLDAIIGKDLSGTVTSWNAGARNIFGYAADEMIGCPITRLIPPDRLGEERAILEELRRRPWVQHFQTQRLTKAGRLIDVSVTVSPIRDREGHLIGASKVARDITAQKQGDRELARMCRLYAALSQVNQAIVRNATPEALLPQVCRVLVEHGGFLMAWIGWHDAQSRRLVPVAEFGDAGGYLGRIEVTTDDEPLGCGPSGSAFRTGRTMVSNAALSDPTMLPWRSELARSGIQACAAFPIHHQGQVCGVLSVYADCCDFFKDKEVALITETAGDVSYALDNFAREDIRRHAEQTARDEMSFSDTMLESMPGIVYFYDTAGRFLRWNRNFESVSGFAAHEIAGMQPLDFFAASDRLRVQQRIAKVFKRGESSIEADFISKDGRATPYFFTGRRTVFQDKTCLIGVGIDVSEHQRAEAELRESRTRLIEAQRMAGLGSWALDLHSHRLDCSEQALEIFGVQRSDTELNGRSFLEFVHPDDRERVQAARQAAMTDTGRLDVEHRIVLQDGSEKVVHQRAHLRRDADGQPTTLVGTVHDITDRARLEAEREARHRAESADLIKSAFLATMSHELRTPLNSIIGFTGIILKGLTGPLNDEQAKQLTMVRASARHLLSLVNDVLDISKIEAGQLDIARSRFDLRLSIEKVIALVAPQAQARRLELRTQLSPALGEAVSDARRFEQILLNLLSNAVKFTDRGHITLTAGLTDDATALNLQVADSGIGIKPADLATLFQPFRQIDAGLARCHDGTGLGLAICRRLAGLMGGHISAHSEWGQGSTFTVVLPLQAPPPPLNNAPGTL